MNCHAFANLVDLFLEGRLSAGRRAEMDRHAAGCSHCEKMGKASLKTETVKAPEWFKERLAKALKEATEIEGTELFRPAEPGMDGRWVWAAAGAYACLLLVLYWSTPNIPSQGLTPLVAFAGETR